MIDRRIFLIGIGTAAPMSSASAAVAPSLAPVNLT